MIASVLETRVRETSNVRESSKTKYDIMATDPGRPRSVAIRYDVRRHSFFVYNPLIFGEKKFSYSRHLLTNLNIRYQFYL